MLLCFRARTKQVEKKCIPREEGKSDGKTVQRGKKMTRPSTLTQRAGASACMMPEMLPPEKRAIKFDNALRIFCVNLKMNNARHWMILISYCELVRGAALMVELASGVAPTRLDNSGNAIQNSLRNVDKTCTRKSRCTQAYHVEAAFHTARKRSSSRVPMHTPVVNVDALHHAHDTLHRACFSPHDTEIDSARRNFVQKYLANFS